MTMSPKKFLKKALKGVRNAATTTTTALGNVASEIAGRYRQVLFSFFSFFFFPLLLCVLARGGFLTDGSFCFVLGFLLGRMDVRVQMKFRFAT